MRSDSDANVSFTEQEWLRYTRHIQLPQVGVSGQTKLKQSHALIVGGGGLGSPVGLYLAAAGVGHISIVDHDEVDVSNLQRQVVFSQSDVNKSKAKSAAERLNALNPDIVISSYSQALDKDLAEALIPEVDIVLDCTDNFAARYLINDVCFHHKKPWLYASVHKFSGQCALFSENTACFRCLFPDYPENVEDCDSAGVMGVLPGMLGTIQANEALKYLCGLNTPLLGSLLLVDALDLTMQKVKLGPSPDCVCCSGNDVADEELCEHYALRHCDTGTDVNSISAAEFFARSDIADTHVIDVRDDEERRAFHLGGRHIKLDTLKNCLSELDKDQVYICYCQSGQRSIRAVKLLAEQGYQALSVSGGILELLRQSQSVNCGPSEQ